MHDHQFGRWLILVSTFAALSGCGSPESALQRQLSKGRGVVTLPDGVTELARELKVPPNSDGLEIVGGQGSVLRAGPAFNGRAILMVQNAARIKMRNFRIEGARSILERPTDLPPASTALLSHFPGSGILIDESKEIEISNVSFHEVAGFAVIASRVKKIKISKINVEESGSHNTRGRNNTTGGVLLEEGTDDFEVRDSTFRKVLGNGVWTHSTYLSQRNFRGVIAGNTFELIGRDAIQVGHANKVRVENNKGKFIGYPFNVVDVEGGGTPVGVDTAGKVDESVYTKNRFEDVNGKCFDLDGFHDGEISENVCINRGPAADYPNGHYALVMNNANQEMESQLITIRDNVFDGTRFGGIFVIGKNHKILRNKLLNLNKAHCNEGLSDLPCNPLPTEPTLTEAGIFLGVKGERTSPATNITIEDNEISGFKMSTRCVLTASTLTLAQSTMKNNKCTDQ
ncbi:MAG: right-handed parallel beta-helix repeat-containing protein [Bryobacterales bacterium]|nr:right-handed parallel beta-helix repeat-containing protein [Bryobacterales bacterium]